jgi:hypothetical protein
MSLVDTKWEGLGRNWSYASSMFSTRMSERNGEDHGHCQNGRFGVGIQTGVFGMQVVSVIACVKLLREVRNSLLQ